MVDLASKGASTATTGGLEDGMDSHRINDSGGDCDPSRSNGLRVTSPSSKVIIYGYVDKGLYGTLDIVFYLDGKQMAARHLDYDPLQDNRIEVVSMTWNVTAGEHRIAYDIANETGHSLDGVMEYTIEVRILPYTSEEILIGVGVGFA